MLNMKKDMGGAATRLALAHMIMGARTEGAAARAYYPAVEEFDRRDRAFRPRDVLHLAQPGISVRDQRNTDAEGRLILAERWRWR